MEKDLSSYFWTYFAGRAFVINDKHDLAEFVQKSRAKSDYGLLAPDYEWLLENGIDAVLLGEDMAYATRYELGWDIPSILVLNKETIIPLIVE